jgi:dihydroflavonol-4-reductase/farnesol dehydrogenase
MLHWPHTRVFIGDLSDTEMLASAMEGCECVYHTAGYSKLWYPDPKMVYATNVQGTANVLKEAIRQHVKKLVYTSSANVFGSTGNLPFDENMSGQQKLNNHFDLSKLKAEELVRNAASAKLKTVIVNPTRVFGGGLMNPANSMDRLLLQLIQDQWILVPRAADIEVCYAFMEDVVQGHVLAMERGISGQQYILGGENISYRVLYKLLKELTGKNNYLRLPLPIMKLSGWYNWLNYQLTGAVPVFTASTIERFFHHFAFSSGKAERELGYRITPFREALESTIGQMSLLRNLL